MDDTLQQFKQLAEKLRHEADSLFENHGYPTDYAKALADCADRIDEIIKRKK